jgi:signal peptidase I
MACLFSIVITIAIAFKFAQLLSGASNPLVVCISGSMAPTLNPGDLLFLSDNRVKFPFQVFEEESYLSSIFPAKIRRAAAGSTLLLSLILLLNCKRTPASLCFTQPGEIVVFNVPVRQQGLSERIKVDTYVHRILEVSKPQQVYL